MVSVTKKICFWYNAILNCPVLTNEFYYEVCKFKLKIGRLNIKNIESSQKITIQSWCYPRVNLCLCIRIGS